MRALIQTEFDIQIDQYLSLDTCNHCSIGVYKRIHKHQKKTKQFPIPLYIGLIFSMLKLVIFVVYKLFSCF